MSTDGLDEHLAGISSMNDFNSKWEIDIDTLDFDLKNTDSTPIISYLHTIIHEIGHLITLNPEQVEVSEDEFQNNEKGYLTSEGYATPDSYLGQFGSSFWKDDLLFSWDKIDNIKIEGRKASQLYRFYLNHEMSFLTDYAAESPEEDIAESWTFFVLSEKPSPNHIKHQKALFFFTKLLNFVPLENLFVKT